MISEHFRAPANRRANAERTADQTIDPVAIRRRLLRRFANDQRLVAPTSDDLRRPIYTTSGHFQVIFTSERISEDLHSSGFASFSIVPSVIFVFFLLFYVSPFAFLSFYTVGYLYACTLVPSIVSESYFVSLSFRTSLAFSFPLTCASRRNTPSSLVTSAPA